MITYLGALEGCRFFPEAAGTTKLVLFGSADSRSCQRPWLLCDVIELQFFSGCPLSSFGEINKMKLKAFGKME